MLKKEFQFEHGGGRWVIEQAGDRVGNSTDSEIQGLGPNGRPTVRARDHIARVATLRTTAAQ